MTHGPDTPQKSEKDQIHPAAETEEESAEIADFRASRIAKLEREVTALRAANHVLRAIVRLLTAAAQSDERMRRADGDQESP